MKQYFLKKQLNVTYGGGLNGFSMIVLFVAYINHAKLKEECNAAVVLEKILRFYGEEFDERKTGINLLNRDKGIFY
jgi:DNA polymerase sigma